MIGVIVEGQGDDEAVPVLARRIAAAHQIYPEISTLRVKRHRVVKEGELEKAITLVAMGSDCTGALVVLDADEDCAAILGPQLQARAAAAARHKVVGVSLAVTEFEAWAIAGIEGARGRRGIDPAAVCPFADPDRVSSPKGALERLMAGHSYLETDDQAAFAALIDIDLVRDRSRSFRKFEKELLRVLGLGTTQT
jgi:hypothetical protein